MSEDYFYKNNTQIYVYQPLIKYDEHRDYNITTTTNYKMNSLDDDVNRNGSQ